MQQEVQRNPFARRRDLSFDPKNAWRPDSRIQDDIAMKLLRLSHAEVGKIRYRVSSGEVLLLGEVQDAKLCRLAETAVQSVWGVQSVRSELSVVSVASQLDSLH